MGWAHAAHVPGRVGPTKEALEHLLAWGFLLTPSSSPKRDAQIFPELSEAVAAAELLIPVHGNSEVDKTREFCHFCEENQELRRHGLR